MIVIPSGLAAAEALAGRELALARVAWNNLLRDLTATSITASGETADGPADAALSPDTYTFWEPDVLPAIWVITLAAASEIGFVGIAEHTLGTAGASILVETSDGSTTGGSPDSDDVTIWTLWSDYHSPTDDAPILLLDSPRTVTQIRLTIDGGTALPRLAVIAAGPLMAMQTKIRGPGFRPLTMSRETTMKRTLSRGGQFLGQEIRRQGVTGSVSFEHLESDWVRETFMPFVTAAVRYPYFFAWRPLEYPLEVAYVWTTSGDIRPQYMGVLDLMNVSWDMAGMADE